MTTIDDRTITHQLHHLRSQLNKKQTFESSIFSLKFLLQSYSSSSPPTKKLFYNVVSRVATVLRTRYTAPGFLLAGIDLLDTAARLFDDPTEISHLTASATALLQSVHLDNENLETRSNGGAVIYLRATSRLTVNRLNPTGNNDNAVNDGGNDDMVSFLRGLVERLEGRIDGLEDLLPADIAARRTAPPASKKVVDAVRGGEFMYI